MKWSTKMKGVVGGVLNEGRTFEPLYRLQISNDNSYILYFGNEKIYETVTTDYLPDHWNYYARQLIKQVIEDRTNKEISKYK